MRHAGHIAGALKVHISPDVLNNLIKRRLLREFGGAAKEIGSAGNTTGAMGSTVSGIFNWMGASPRNLAYARNNVILFHHSHGELALTWSIYQANLPVQ